GYLKFTLAAEGASVFFRGQSKLYNELKPALLREVTTADSMRRRQGRLREYLSEIDASGQVLKAVPGYAREPLLQHYGMRTNWVDLVDNVWVALWFACARAHH